MKAQYQEMEGGGKWKKIGERKGVRYHTKKIDFFFEELCLFSFFLEKEEIGKAKRRSRGAEEQRSRGAEEQEQALQEGEEKGGRGKGRRK